MKQTYIKLIIVVRKGLVETVYCNKKMTAIDVEVLEMDTIVPDEIRSANARETQIVTAFIEREFSTNERAVVWKLWL